MSKKIWLLDPGHGGLDPETGKYVTSGKRSPKWEDGSQYFEGLVIETLLKELYRNAQMMAY